MKLGFYKSILGYTMASIIINRFWSIFPDQLGIKGGWISALVLTGSMWYMNHYRGLVDNKSDAAFVDMGLAIGLANIVRDILKNGINSFESSIPTLMYVCLGGILGGIVGGILQKSKNGENN